MHDKSDEQNRLVIATFIIATTFVLYQLTGINILSSSGVVFLDFIIWGVSLSIAASAFLSTLFIMSKALELRYNISKSFTRRITARYLVKNKEWYYNASVSIYIPVILGIIIFYLVLALDPNS